MKPLTHNGRQSLTHPRGKVLNWMTPRCQPAVLQDSHRSNRATPYIAVGRATCFLPTWPVPRLLHRCGDYWEPTRASPGVQMVKNPPANAGDVRDTSSIPGSGRFPWRRARQPIPLFLSGESLGQRSLGALVHTLAKCWTRLNQLSTHAQEPNLPDFLLFWSHEIRAFVVCL